MDDKLRAMLKSGEIERSGGGAVTFSSLTPPFHSRQYDTCQGSLAMIYLSTYQDVYLDASLFNHCPRMVLKDPEFTSNRYLFTVRSTPV